MLVRSQQGGSPPAGASALNQRQARKASSNTGMEAAESPALAGAPLLPEVE